MTSYRRKFANFKKSKQGHEVKSMLYRQQLYNCISCFTRFDIQDLDIHHLIPISILEKQNDLDKVSNIKNLVLLCRSCNCKQSNKIDERFN